MAMTVPDLLKMSQAQLDDLFTKSPPGGIPDGEVKGAAIVAPRLDLGKVCWKQKRLIDFAVEIPPE